MALSCGAKCAKGVLISFNFIFWLSGCALVGLGIWLLFDPNKTMLFNLVMIDGKEPIFHYLAYGFIGIGGFVLLVGIIGCCGALQESKCLLVLYFITLFLVLGCEVAIGVLAVIFKGKVLEEVKTELTSKLQKDYGDDAHKAFSNAIDFAQYKFNCCGISSPGDYNESTWKTKEANKGLNVSHTCCKLTNNGSAEAWLKPEVRDEASCQSEDPKVNKEERHQQGCRDAIQDFVKQESLILIAVGLGVSGLEIFGMIIAICLCRSLGETVEA